MPRTKPRTKRKPPADRTLMIAGATVTKSQVTATIALFRYFHRFLKSDCTHCLIPGDWTRRKLTKQEARRHLDRLIDVAINRKAGIPDETYAECEQMTHWRRDQQRLRDIGQRIRVYQFETVEVRQRFGHLLSRYDD